MGAGGRQNYAQAAMQTLFGERLKQMGNQPAQSTETNQEFLNSGEVEKLNCSLSHVYFKYLVFFNFSCQYFS